MMRSLLVFSLLIVCLGCDLTEASLDSERLPAECGGNNPVENLPWLKAEIEAYRTPSMLYDVFVYTATYRGITVFFTSICCPACNVSPPIVRNCQGESLGMIGIDLLQSNLRDQKIIWKTENQICQE
jgi:hypothetical protein